MTHTSHATHTVPGIDTPTIEASPDFRKKVEEVKRTVQDTFAKANETATLAANLDVSCL